MTATVTLKRARALLAGGWTNGAWGSGGTRADGTPCEWNDEGVLLFTVDGALRATTRDERELLDAWRQLELAHHPLMSQVEELLAALPRDSAGDVDAARISVEDVRRHTALCRAVEAAGETHLDEWLRAADRKAGDVLRLFDLAILRSPARAASTVLEGARP
jgi:hypothetical protein